MLVLNWQCTCMYGVSIYLVPDIFCSLAGSEMQTSPPNSTQNELVHKVAGVGGKAIQRRVKSRRRASQLRVAFPRFAGDHKTSRHSLQQMSVNQQCDHNECKSKLAAADGVRSLHGTETEQLPVTDSNFEKKTPTQPKQARCTTHLNGSAECMQPSKSKPGVAVTERDTQGHNSPRWHQPKVTNFMESSAISPSPNSVKQGTCTCTHVNK